MISGKVGRAEGTASAKPQKGLSLESGGPMWHDEEGVTEEACLGVPPAHCLGESAQPHIPTETRRALEVPYGCPYWTMGKLRSEMGPQSKLGSELRLV